MEVSECWKIAQFPKSLVKTKNCKTFYESQTASLPKEIIQPPPTDKILLRLLNKNFFTEIQRDIQTFAFKVLQECGSWASRNRAVQMFFLTPNRNMFAGKFLSPERFLAALREHTAFNVKWVEVRKKGWGFLGEIVF